MSDARLRLKTEHERLADLEEELAHLSYVTAADPEASRERVQVLEAIEMQKAAIRDLKAASDQRSEGSLY